MTKGGVARNSDLFKRLSSLYRLRPTYPIRDPRTDMFAAVGTFDGSLGERLSANIGDSTRSDRIRVEIVQLPPDIGGEACILAQFLQADHVFVRGVSDVNGFHWRVRLNLSHRPAERFVTLAHEIAHIYCGHCGPSHHPGDWPDRRFASRIVQEIEAEMVAGVIAEMAKLNSGVPGHLFRLLKVAETYGNAHHGVAIKIVREAAERVSREAGLPLPDPSWFSARRNAIQS